MIEDVVAVFEADQFAPRGAVHHRSSAMEAALPCRWSTKE
jgi:hypothetical protein